MTFDEFKRSLGNAAPPAGLTPTLVALWHDGKGDWDAAHRAVQDVDDEKAAWVHAYLHRKEGDAANAGYWYRRAGRRHAHMMLDEEWAEIVTALLSD